MAARMRDQNSGWSHSGHCTSIWGPGRSAAVSSWPTSALRWEGRIESLVLLQELGLESLDDRGEQNHFTFPQSMEKPFISSLIARVALWSVPEVRRVYLAVVRMER